MPSGGKHCSTLPITFSSILQEGVKRFICHEEKLTTSRGHCSGLKLCTPLI